MDGGSVFVKFKGESSDLANKVNEIVADIKDKLSSLNDSKVLNGIKSFTSTAGSYYADLAKLSGAALIGALGTTVSVMKQSIKAAGDLEQQIGGTEAVFGEFADTVQKKATKSFSTMGTSANEYMETINKMGSIMQGAGFTVEDSMNTASEVMQRAADVASVMGISTEEAMTAITGAAKGNFTMMDNLGVAMNATTLQAYAMSKGINKSYREMTNAEKSGLAYQMFLEKTAKYAGNYARENQTLNGSITTLKASIDNFMAGAGSAEDVVNSAVNAISVIATKLVEMTPDIINGLVSMINQLSTQLPQLIVQMMPAIITGAVNLMTGLVKAVPTVINALKPALPQLTTAFIMGMIEIIKAVAYALPDMIPAIINAILTIIPVLIENMPLFINAGLQLLLGLLDGMIQGIGTLISNIPKIFQSIITGIKNFFGIHSPSTKLMEIGKQLLEGLKNGILGKVSNVISGIKDIPGKIINKFKDGFSSIGNVGKNLLTGLTNGISNGVKSAVNAASSAAKSVLNKFKSIFGVHSPSTEFMWVGEMNMEGLNKGMKEMSPEVQRSIDGLFNLSPSMSGAVSNNLSPNVVVNATLNYEQDPLGQVVSNIKTFSGGAKNDYNYGMGGM